MRVIILAGASIPFATAEEAPFTAAEAERARAKIESVLKTHLTDPLSGAVFVNAARDRPVIAGEARNRDCLSEAVGQMMELALLREDRPLFEQQFDLVRNRFSPGRSGFLAWKISIDTDWAATTSATLDDWRVVWATGVAERRWGLTEAGTFGRNLAAAIVRGSADRVLPPPAFNLGDGSPGDGVVLLCYLHLPAMAGCAEQVPGLSPLLDRSRKLLESLPGLPGMVPQSWNPKDKGFSPGFSDETLALLTMQYLHGVDPESRIVREAIAFRLTHLAEHGQLPKAFNLSDAHPQAEPAGASVYALLARLLVATGRMSEAGMALRKMLEFQTAESDKYPGAIGGYPVFSFDQLEALLALEDFLRASARTGKGPLENTDDARGGSSVPKDL